MKPHLIFALLIAPVFLLDPLRARADAPQIEAVSARNSGAGWTLNVTLRHPDSGWEHYADAWEVLAPDGARLGLRLLTHPHEDEQPFTRSLAGVEIPAGTDYVMIRARCLVDGWAGDQVRVDLTE
jgi:hypothetical protein